jgi:hypothetical protein
MSVLRPRWWYVGLAGLGVLPLLSLSHMHQGPRQGPRFCNVQELKAWAEGRGLYCRSDWQDGRVTDGLAVATHPLTWEQVAIPCRGAPGQGAEWEGMIWATSLPADWDVTPVPLWGGEYRVWGGICVTGDRCLLDRLEGQGN